MRARRKVIDDVRHSGVDVLAIDQVIVVEHQHDIVADASELIEQQREDRLDRRRLGVLQQCQRARIDPWQDGLKRGDQVGPERCGVVVALVEGQPCHRRAPRCTRSEPVPDKCRLAEPCWCSHQCELRVENAVQPLTKSPTWHDAARRPWREELRLE